MLIPLEGQHVTGNQEGATNVKKPRTWRQYMNRYVFSKYGLPVIVTLHSLFVGVEDSIGLWIKSSRFSSHCQAILSSLLPPVS